MQWFRRSFIAGVVVTVPLFVTVVAFVWIFQVVDGVMAPLFARWLGLEVPGLGLLTTLVAVFAVGVTATNVFGRRLLERAEQYLLRLPIFRAVYAPVKQLVAAFSPENDMGFKRVVLIEHPRHGFVLGFLTKEFTLDRGQGPEALVAVYVPTNHLYLGNVLISPRALAYFPSLSVQEGIRIFLTGGMALSERVAVMENTEPERASEVTSPHPGR